MPKNKESNRSTMKGYSLRTCRHREVRGQVYLENQRIADVLALELLPSGPRCESSGARCSVASWNAACWWSLDVVHVGQCARISYLSSEPAWSECATVVVEPPWRALREERPFDWIAWGLAAPRRPGPFDV